jgi:hypothetical protein
VVTAFGHELGDTDFEGRATIEWPDDLPQRGRLRLRAYGFLEAEAKYVVPHGAQAVMVPAAEIQGTVVRGADMLPVDGAVVTTGGSTTRTEVDGAFFISDISPGPHVLTARSPNGLGSTEPIEVGIGQLVDGVTIVLEPGCTVRGAVRPVDEIDIPLTAKVGAASADVLEDGSFEIIGAKLDDRSLFLSSAALGTSFAHVGPISIDPCSSKVDVELPSFSRAVIDVVDEVGQPVPGAEVEVQYRGESGSGGLAPFRTDLDGSCAVEGLGPGTLRIDVKIPGAEVLQVDLPASEPIVVRLDGVVRSVDGRIVDLHHEPVRVAKLVRLAPRTGGGATYVNSDLDGRFEFSHVPSGAYHLSVHAGRNPAELAALELEVGREDRHELEVEIPTETASLTGRVVDDLGAPVDNAIIDIRTHSGGKPGWITNPGKHFVVTESDGSFTLEGFERGINLVLTAFEEQTGQSFPTIASPGTDVEIRVVPLARVDVRHANRPSSDRCRIRVSHGDEPLFHVSVTSSPTVIGGIPLGETALEMICGGSRDTVVLDLGANEVGLAQFE